MHIDGDASDPIKRVPGYDNYYVSASGRFFRELKPQFNADGYRHVRLKGKTIKTAKLVIAAFVGPRPDGMVVCHNDGNRSNDSIENLRYDTQANNIADIKRHGNLNPPSGSRNGMSKLTDRKVIEMRRRYAKGGISHAALGREYGVSREQARDIINGKFWRHLGQPPPDEE